jgi:hypothetical protein
MIHEKPVYKTQWTLTKFASDLAFQHGLPFAVEVIDGNMLLNEGIGALLLLLTGGAETAFNNANARLGVGDSSTAEAASQTDLQAAANKTYKAMQSSYPQISAQTVTFRAVFASADANYAWNEFVIDNGGSALKTLNRKVSSQGTKASGQTWTLDVAVTFS